MPENRAVDSMAKKLESLKLFTKLRSAIKKDRKNDAVKGSTSDNADEILANDYVIEDSVNNNTVQGSTDGNAVTNTADGNEVTDSASVISASVTTLPQLPVEIIGDISSYLSLDDIKKMRLVCKRFRYATKIIFGKALVTKQTLYPTYASLSHFLTLLLLDRDYPPLVKTVTLVSDAPRVHEHGAPWAWSVMEGQEAVTPSMADRAVKHYINSEHKLFCHFNNFFITTGGYRTLLTMLFSRLINLHTVQIRNIRPDEHIPEFKAAACLKDLSYYRPNLKTRNIFYGEWQYDTLHRRVTTWVDEYGEHIYPHYSGPQVGCADDVAAAIGYTRSDATIEHIN